MGESEEKQPKCHTPLLCEKSKSRDPKNPNQHKEAGASQRRPAATEEAKQRSRAITFYPSFFEFVEDTRQYFGVQQAARVDRRDWERREIRNRTLTDSRPTMVEFDVASAH